MLSLHQESGYNQLVSYYEANKDRPWHEWLEVKQVFPRPGKQGLVGVMQAKENAEISYVFKLSQYMNYLVLHEQSVMQSLNELGDYCPHFCRSVGIINCEVDPMKRKGGNPFELESKYKVEKDILLMEHLHKSSKLCNYIFSDKIDEKILYSSIKQVLLAISIAQKEKQFTHYDLHSNNIMMRKCSKDLVFLYILDEQNQFCIPTYGYYPVIIDFGFSFVQDLNGGPLWPSLNHTEVGFTSDRFDPIADPKLFLVTVANEIREARKTSHSKKLKNITKNVYSSLPIDWESGWDMDMERCATDYVIRKIGKYSKVSNLFTEYEYYCLDLLQSLIVLPLEDQKIDNVEVSYLTFLKEFTKIEAEIGTPFYCLYILKGIVDAARVVRSDYINESTRNKAMGYFRMSIQERIDSVAKYCQLKEINYERMLCGLLCVVKGIEGILYQAMAKQSSKKEKQYAEVPIQTPEEICAVIDINIEDDYEWNERTTVMVIDNKNRTCYPIELTDEQRECINSYCSISRGSELYKIMNAQNLSM